MRLLIAKVRNQWSDRVAGFLYYLPGRGPDIKLADVRALGLGYAFDEQLTPRQCLRGPDNGSGVIIAASDQRVGYYQGQQDWRPIPHSSAWIGLYRDERPAPADLARTELLDGLWIKCDDGHSWLVPKARRWEEFDGECYSVCGLPQRLSLTAEGQWQLGAVKSRYEQLWRWVCAYEQAFAEAVQAHHDGDVVRFTFDAINDMAIAALQANYRVAAIELDLLGIYDLQARERIVDALLDVATWRAWVKKKCAALARNGSPSVSGGEPSMAGDAVATTPPSPSCAPTPPDCTATTKLDPSTRE